MAKMMGITPDEFTLNGRKVLPPAVTLPPPTTRRACCTGTLRTACTRVIPASVSAVWVRTLPASVIGEVVPQIGSVGTTTGNPWLAR